MLFLLFLVLWHHTRAQTVDEQAFHVCLEWYSRDADVAYCLLPVDR